MKKKDKKINSNIITLLEDEKIEISKRKYESLINEIGYLRGSKKF